MTTPAPRLLSSVKFAAIAASGLMGFALTFSHAAQPVPEVPDWALPGSATHTQVPPPAGFTRASTHFKTPIGIFEGQSEVGSAVVPGSASFDAKTKTYSINSAGYNIWYFRDEFRYLWKKMSGDVSLAVDVTFPNANGYDDRKVVLVIRQDLDDNSKEVMTALHGAGLIHLAQRPEKGVDIVEICRDPGHGPVGKNAVRIGIEKRGDVFTLFVGQGAEPMKPVGKPTTLKFDAPFYVGIGFTSHVPNQVDTGNAANVVLKNSAGEVR